MDKLIKWLKEKREANIVSIGQCIMLENDERVRDLNVENRLIEKTVLKIGEIQKGQSDGTISL